ncbi:MAG: hypothetical protein JNM10_10640 [Planctomycetia bacterium]|nr:hypothetical protein [Planctomycetia bacterium]
MRASVWMRVVTCLVAAIGVVGSVGPVAGRARAEDAPPTTKPQPAAEAPADDRTDVVLTTDAPIVRGRNLLWCATGQLAWDALADLVGTDGRLDLERAQDPALVEALNRRAFPHDALDAASVAVAAGFGKDGVLERIRQAWTKLHPDGARAPELVAAPDEAVAFAALRKQLPFETPFRLLPEPMHFDGGDRPLTAFGMMRYDHGPDADAQAKQVRVFPPPGARPDGDEGAGVVELRPAGLADRIFLANLPPGATLEDTWNGAWSRVGAREGITPEHAEDLVIPRIRLDVRRGFPGIAGAHLHGRPDHVLRVVQQEVTFSLTKRGAAVESAAVLLETEGLGMRMRFDRPFLLALLRRGATRPYLLAWVGNDAWLEPAAKAERLGAEDLAALGGRWVLDDEATVRAGVAAELRLNGPGPYPDPKDRSRTISFEEALARRVAERLSSPHPTTATVTIDEHGGCTLDLGSRPERLAIRRVGDRWMLFQPQGRLRVRPATPGSPEDLRAQEELVERGRPVLLRFDGTRLEIPEGALFFKRP